MNFISGIFSVFLGLAFFAIVLLQLANLIMASQVQGADQQVIISLLAIMLFSILGYRSIVSGKAKLALDEYGAEPKRKSSASGGDRRNEGPASGESLNPLSDIEGLPAVVKNMGSKQEKAGRDFADYCLVNGLRKGEMVSLLDAIQTIHADHECMPGAVESGFMERMKGLVDSGEIQTVNVEGRGVLFVHSDHVDNIINSMNTAREKLSGDKDSRGDNSQEPQYVELMFWIFFMLLIFGSIGYGMIEA